MEKEELIFILWLLGQLEYTSGPVGTAQSYPLIMEHAACDRKKSFNRCVQLNSTFFILLQLSH